VSVGSARLREEPDVIRKGAIDKGEDPALVDVALAIDEERRQLQAKVDALRAERNRVSERVGEAIRGGADAEGPEVAALRSQSSWIGAELAGLEGRLGAIQARLDEALLRIPNPPDPDVPVGGEEASRVIRGWGEPGSHAEPATDAQAAWERRPHWEVAESLGMLDLAAGAKVTGSGFPLYRGAGAALQRALIDFFLDLHTREHGMTEIWPPALVNTDSARGTGQLPDKEDQMYVVTRDELFLVPTAEVPVTNIHRDEIVEADRLPIRYVAYSPCFRREAGAAGAKTRGILRVHQFDKVEMVAFVRPAESEAALEWMTQRAEVCLQRLGLPYRVKLMATRDMGFTQARKYDLEVWAPGVADWLEVSSVSNFRDYQARRMNIRWRPEPGGKPEVLHTLNGSGLALARTVAAILEVYQQADGSLLVPEPLRPRLGERITPS
jgi:seryl-tRNA synthetase